MVNIHSKILSNKICFTASKEKYKQFIHASKSSSQHALKNQSLQAIMDSSKMKYYVGVGTLRERFCQPYLRKRASEGCGADSKLTMN